MTRDVIGKVGPRVKTAAGLFRADYACLGARVLQQAEADGVVRMPADQVESPTCCGHLAAALLHLAR